MSKRAEEAALKAYPVYGKWIGNQYGDWDNDINSTLRKAYLQGYEQAEKDTNPQEQPEVDLEKFTEKMDAWKARYNYPNNIPIKAAMAFTARMFYQYPNVARQWYDSLPKATMD